MTATNHALTGTAIGLLVGIPIVALPAAFASHFILDSLPHYGAKDRDKAIKSKGFKRYLIVEATLCFMIVAALFLIRPEHWLLASICAFLAASPDLYWIRKYKAALKNTKYKPDWFAKFASNIQWFQRPIGAIVEVAWFAATLTILIPLIKTLAKS